MTSIATCISEQVAGLGTTLSFIFRKPIENDPLGNFLEQEFVTECSPQIFPKLP